MPSPSIGGGSQPPVVTPPTSLNAFFSGQSSNPVGNFGLTPSQFAHPSAPSGGGPSLTGSGSTVYDTKYNYAIIELNQGQNADGQDFDQVTINGVSGDNHLYNAEGGTTYVVGFNDTVVGSNVGPILGHNNFIVIANNSNINTQLGGYNLVSIYANNTNVYAAGDTVGHNIFDIGGGSYNTIIGSEGNYDGFWLQDSSHNLIDAQAGIKAIIDNDTGGHDTLYGGTGGSTITLTAGQFNVVVGLAGNDTLNSSGASGLNYLDAGAGSNSITTSGHDIVYSTDGGTGQDTVANGAGDVISFAFASQVKLTAGDSGASATIGSHTYSYGSSASTFQLTQHGNDQVYLSGHNNYNIGSGGSGNILVDASANAGNDTLFAGSGNDYLGAGAGSDILYAGTGNDMLTTVGAGYGIGHVTFNFQGYNSVTQTVTNQAIGAAETIQGFISGQDSIVLSHTENPGGFASVTLSTSNGNTNVLINGGHTTLTIMGDTNLTASDFVFA